MGSVFGVVLKVGSYNTKYCVMYVISYPVIAYHVVPLIHIYYFEVYYIKSFVTCRI